MGTCSINLGRHPFAEGPHAIRKWDSEFLDRLADDLKQVLVWVGARTDERFLRSQLALIQDFFEGVGAPILDDELLEETEYHAFHLHLLQVSVHLESK